MGELTILQISDCLVEQDVGYTANDVNNGKNNVQANVTSCRASCRSRAAAYFSFKRDIDRACWCKNSSAGREAKRGVVSGETSCRPGEIIIQFNLRRIE